MNFSDLKGTRFAKVSNVGFECEVTYCLEIYSSQSFSFRLIILVKLKQS